MFVILTKYFFQYREMNIPGIGAFKLIEVPASLDIVNKLMHPPGYDIMFSNQLVVKEHQLSYLASTLHCDKAQALFELERFGESLKSSLYNDALLWKGLGTLKLSDGIINFQVDPQKDLLLQPVPAERVLRDRNQQTVLMGDKEVQTGLDEYVEVPEKKRSPVMIIAWVLILLSIAFIGFHFYKQGMKPSSSGNQMKIKIEKSR
ncbi:hypothetical protein OCK74_16915 [Chitinophagaceae bacterium LB-8]|uniref:CCDC81-like prokaryotic HU domain-containing protein n=1 Tax=Paraflavisolibacter caeni TaxID=2982496 RepID=A0A9X2Y0G6_9BACT|nr:hypothetical protein [Paraflavisolibacter caeni]MCU7550803.1 hypothetical protein [Paraflavisolibacter caeni]